MKRSYLVVPVFAVLLALVPSTALASTQYQESVFGIETGIPQSTSACPSPDSVSSFAGVATGTLRGVFAIAVCHEPLAPSARILGGTFVVTNGATRVVGAFEPGGSVTYVTTAVIGSLCIQKFAVAGQLDPGPGHFAGNLLHYGALVGASCNVFFATISGHAVLYGP